MTNPGAQISDRLHPKRAFVLTLGLGAAWYAFEIALGALEIGAGGLARLFSRAVTFLPLQIVEFSLFGSASAVCAALLSIRKEDGVWLALAMPSLGILGGRIADGAVRRFGLLNALLCLLLAAFAICGLLALARQCVRRFDARGTLGLAPALWAAWTASFVPIVRAAGPNLTLDGLTWAGVIDMAGHFRAGVVAAAVAFAVGVVHVRRRWFAAGVLLLLSPGSEALAEPPRPDVLIVLVDTLRWDHLGANVGDSATTPFMSSLAQESVRFSHAFSPSNFTRMAMPGVLTSAPWVVTGEPIGERTPSIATLLRRSGYSTAGFSANPFVSRRYGYQHGFDTFVDPGDAGEFLATHFAQVLGNIFPGPSYRTGLVSAEVYFRSTSSLGAEALAIPRDASRPAFLYVHGMEPHGPYLPPKRYLGPSYRHGDFFPFYRFHKLSRTGVLNTAAFRPHLENLRQRYRGAVGFVDDQLEALVSELRRRGRWDETLVWILSDHGESFGEHDYAGHGGDRLPLTLIRVPALLKLPKSMATKPRVEAQPISTFDVLPTTLGLLGIDPAPGIFGVNLAALVRDRTPLGERCIVSSVRSSGVDYYSCVQWPWKLDVGMSSPARSVALYQLEQDPMESIDLARQHADVVQRLSTQLELWRAREAQHSRAQPASEVDAATREKLKALGYVE